MSELSLSDAVDHRLWVLIHAIEDIERINKHLTPADRKSVARMAKSLLQMAIKEVV